MLARWRVLRVAEGLYGLRTPQGLRKVTLSENPAHVK